MWPRLLAQLLELLPHVTQLVPMANKYLTSRSASEQTHQAALAALALDMHANLDGLSSAHTQTQARLTAQLDLQAAHLAQLTDSLQQLQADCAARTLATDRQLRTLALWIKAGGAVLIALLLTLLVLALKR
jgi:hypothetical protein